ncbi:MAG: metallophosphoesterase [Promethearchaeota archaeon]
MKIGVISDTHDHMENVKKAVNIFLERKVDAVFHCGDIIAPFMWMPFEELKKREIPFYAVYGNNDGERAGLKTIFGKVCEIKGDFLEMELDGKKIIMFHHLSNEMVDALAKSGKYDLILKGHTHQKVNKKLGKTLLINPGEACGYLSGIASIAIVNLDDLSTEIIDIY